MQISNKLKRSKINPLLELYQIPPSRWTTVMRIQALSYFRTVDFFINLEKEGMDLTTLILQATNTFIPKNSKVELYGQTIFLYTGELVIFNKKRPEEMKKTQKSTLFMTKWEKRALIHEVSGGMDYQSFTSNK